MIRVGITGNIGSGKSTCCAIFELLNVPIYYADNRAKWLMTHDTELKNNIINLLGSAAYQENGDLDRPYIGSKIFSDKSLLTSINALVHPAVHQDANSWFERQAKMNFGYAMYEAALIIETGGQERLDKLILVTADAAIRRSRVAHRDDLTEKDVQRKMDNQMSEESKLPFADFVIKNDGDQLIIPQVLAVHSSILGIQNEM